MHKGWHIPLTAGAERPKPCHHGGLALALLRGFWFVFNGEDRKQASLRLWLSLHFGDGRGGGCVVRTTLWEPSGKLLFIALFAL